MSFTGKATYTAGSTLPEIAEDVSDLIGVASPHATPLLDALGDAYRPARSTVHEWLEDALLPNTGTLVSISGDNDELLTVADASLFRVGDQLRMDNLPEIMLVTAINTGTNVLTVERGYGGTTVGTLSAGTLYILANAALEGDDAADARFTSRSRRTNYTQIFSATLEVSGSQLAVQNVGVRDEIDWQKAQRGRELLRDLENSVINGVAAETNPQGSATVRRTMRGMLRFISTNVFEPGVAGFPDDGVLTEEQLNQALRGIWQNSAGQVDLIVVGGREKRAINRFVETNRRFASSATTFRDHIDVYESDFGVCRVVLSRAVPAGTVLLLDSSRVDVVPLAGRSFHYKPLARTGDRESGMVVGEYTLEFRNENAHGVIRGLTGVDA